MKKHINTNFRQFILEHIKRVPRNKEEELEEVQPDDVLDYVEVQDEPEEEPIDFDSDYKEIIDDDEVQDEDDLIKELYQKYKKLRQQYEHRLHKRKSRKTLR